MQGRQERVDRQLWFSFPCLVSYDVLLLHTKSLLCGEVRCGALYRINPVLLCCFRLQIWLSPLAIYGRRLQWDMYCILLQGSETKLGRGLNLFFYGSLYRYDSVLRIKTALLLGKNLEISKCTTYISVEVVCFIKLTLRNRLCPCLPPPSTPLSSGLNSVIVHLYWSCCVSMAPDVFNGSISLLCTYVHT